MSVPTSSGLNGVWASSRSDAWAVGPGGLVLHFDGSEWSEVASGTSASLFAVWGLAPDDVWAVGSGGTTIHWNGLTWEPTASGVTSDLRDVHGSSPDDVWAVGSGPMIHWNGTLWVSHPSVTGSTVVASWTEAPGNAWCVTNVNQAFHWDGATWTEAPPFGSVVNPQDIAVPGASGPVVLGTRAILRLEGDAWVPVGTPPSLNLLRLWAVSDAEMFAVGAGSEIVRWRE